jgi:hypothetical protein
MNYFPRIPWVEPLANPIGFEPDDGIEHIGAQAGVALDGLGDPGLGGDIMLAATQSALRAAERAAAENEAAAVPAATEQAPPSEGYISRLMSWIFPKS